jgi:hypothetical protein
VSTKPEKRDFSQIALDVVRQATGEKPPTPPNLKPEKTCHFLASAPSPRKKKKSK